MKDKGPFVSIPNEIDIVGESPLKRPDVDTLKSMAYLGQSKSHRIYWNKTSSSFGLLCGSSEFEDRISDTLQVDKINSVARLFVRSHLEKEPGARTCPRVLVFHTGNHMVHKSSPALLDAKNMTVLVSPRVVQSTTQTMERHAPRPLRFSEDDISLHHVLALFSPPPEMDHASASRILTTVQYVISQLPTDSPFDLQTFIQLIEQEKWDDEGSTFIALRQTLLTGLLASYEDDFENNSIRLPLKSLDKVTLDLTDPILCSTRLDGVLMDMALQTFLKPSVDQNEKTMIILSAADEYLHASSPLLRSLCSLASEESRNISVVVMTTNLSSLALLPNVFDALDYVALAGPVRSSTWLETIRTHWISILFPETPSKILSRNMLGIISPDSQLLESVQDGERWSIWEDGCTCVELDKSLSVRPQWATAGDVLGVAEQPHWAEMEESGDDMSISDGSHKAALGVLTDVVGSTKAAAAAISGPVAEVTEVPILPEPLFQTTGRTMQVEVEESTIITPREPKTKATEKKDPNAPKKALSPYMFFTQEHREIIKKENPGIGFGAVAKKLAAKWKSMSDKDKELYVEKHQVDKKRAEEAKEAYESSQRPLSSPPDPLPSPNRGSSRSQQSTLVAQDNDSDSEDSSIGEGSLEVGISPINAIQGLLHNGTLLRPDLVPFFNIKSDLPPEAFIRASVEVSMYPDEFSLLTKTILRLSGGYSNVGVAQKEICAIIRPFMTTMKSRGAPLPFKNCNKMIAKAWNVHIVRYSAKEAQAYVFLVNTQNAVDKLNLHGAIGTHPLPRNTITRTVSPYMPLVQSLVHLAGNRASVPVPFKLVRKEVGEVMAHSLGFPKFAQYVKDACLVGLVTKQGAGKHRTLSLRADWNYLQGLLVLRPDATNHHA